MSKTHYSKPHSNKPSPEKSTSTHSDLSPTSEASPEENSDHSLKSSPTSSSELEANELTNAGAADVKFKTFQAFFKTPYNHDRDYESDRTALYCNDESLAQQHEEEAANINNIVRNFGVTGKLPEVRLPPTLHDFDTQVFDFQSAMNIMAAAKDSFMQLPADVRSAFNNNPQLFVAQVDAWQNEPDEKERARHKANMRAMGLTVEPGPVADKTTLGDVLAAIKAQSRATGDQAPGTPTAASQAAKT